MTSKLPTYQIPDRNLALELVRVTESAAMAAGPWVGRGEKNLADGAAVEAMRTLISTVSMNGTVVIGEGEKDEAPMLFNGEQVGDGTGPDVDVAVDPIDGTTLTAKGMPNAVSVLAVSERGSMYDPSAVFYMDKLVTGPEAADVVDIRLPVAENIRRIAKAKGTSNNGVTVVLLDRPRHADRRARAQRLVAHRHVRAGDEHDERKPDVGEKRKGAVMRIEHPRAGLTERKPDGELADDDRQPHGTRQRQQRPEHRDETDESELREVHGRRDLRRNGARGRRCAQARRCSRPCGNSRRRGGSRRR